MGAVAADCSARPMKPRLAVALSRISGIAPLCIFVDRAEVASAISSAQRLMFCILNGFSVG